MNAEVKLFDTLSEIPAAALVPEYHSEIVAAGCSQGNAKSETHMGSWAIAALIDGDCVGYMAVWPCISQDHLWISDAYVKPEHRRKGIHDLMFRRVVEQAKKEGVSQIQSGVHINNKASQASCEKQGRRIFGYFYAFDVTE